MSKTLRTNKINKIMYISIGCVIATVILFITLYMAFNGNSNNQNTNLQTSDNSNQKEPVIEEASSSIGNSVAESAQNLDYEELQNEEPVLVETNNETKINENIIETNLNEFTNSEEQSQIENIQNDEDLITQAENNNQSETDTQEKTNFINEEEQADPIFSMPVEGEIVKQYGKEKLIYSETLKEWTTHLGIDIKANKTTIVKATADGCIKSIKNDPRYGLTVVIEHEKGFTSVYSNLLTAEFVVVGENVKSGQTIGTVGNSATFEILDDPHLHFEILKDNNSVDPEMYIK